MCSRSKNLSHFVTALFILRESPLIPSVWMSTLLLPTPGTVTEEMRWWELTWVFGRQNIFRVRLLSITTGNNERGTSASLAQQKRPTVMAHRIKSALPRPVMIALMKTAACLNGEDDEIASVYSLISSDSSWIKKRGLQHIAQLH